ncbi:MAG: FlgD immunoglobulin-like domain containing protein, partial [Desulfotignum sp.]
MTISSTGTAVLEDLSSSYVPHEKEKAEKDDALGQDAFLTMLVAQLENQDPLNPMEGTDFSAQLAQFSQLEQLIYMNKSMDNLAGSFSDKSSANAVDFIGRQVTGHVNAIDVEQGFASGGVYDLSEPSDVIITITNDQGKTVKTIVQGQQEAGTHSISWDGKDSQGKQVADGSYTYSVSANSGFGFTEIPSEVSGIVEGIAYKNGNPYLVVQGAMLSPDAVTFVAGNGAETDSSTENESILGYLGQTITSDNPVVQVENSEVSGTGLGFALEAQEAAVVHIMDGYGQIVRTIALDAEDTREGDNTVDWDGLSDAGAPVPDGLYYYGVDTASQTASATVSGEVAGIKNINNIQYLELDNTGR